MEAGAARNVMFRSEGVWDPRLRPVNDRASARTRVTDPLGAEHDIIKEVTRAEYKNYGI